MINVYPRQQFARDYGDIRLITKIVTDIAFQTRYPFTVIIFQKIDYYRITAERFLLFIESLKVPDIDFDRLTIKIRFLDFFRTFYCFAGALRLFYFCFQQIPAQQIGGQLLIGNDEHLDFQNLLFIIPCHIYSVPEESREFKNIIRLIKIVIYFPIACFIKKIIHSPIKLIHSACC